MKLKQPPTVLRKLHVYFLLQNHAKRTFEPTIDQQQSSIHGRRCCSLNLSSSSHISHHHLLQQHRTIRNGLFVFLRIKPCLVLQIGENNEDNHNRNPQHIFVKVLCSSWSKQTTNNIHQQSIQFFPQPRKHRAKENIATENQDTQMSHTQPQ